MLWIFYQADCRLCFIFVVIRSMVADMSRRESTIKSIMWFFIFIWIRIRAHLYSLISIITAWWRQNRLLMYLSPFFSYWHIIPLRILFLLFRSRTILSIPTVFTLNNSLNFTIIISQYRRKLLNALIKVILKLLQGFHIIFLHVDSGFCNNL